MPHGFRSSFRNWCAETGVSREAAAGGLPVVFWIHGGGYIVGDNTTEDRWGAVFCRSFDCAVVAAGYRLAPEHPFPAGLDDLRAAMQWVLDHGADHGLDPTRILVGGESAGGGLAAALAQRLHDDGVPIAGQLLACPMLDDRTAVRTDIGRREHLGWSNGSNHLGWSCYLGAEPGGDSTPEYAVPARRSDLSGLPPTWIGVGDLDVFWDEDIEYAHRLEEAGVPVTLETAEGGPHGYQAIAPKAAISKRFPRRRLCVHPRRCQTGTRRKSGLATTLGQFPVSLVPGAPQKRPVHHPTAQGSQLRYGGRRRSQALFRFLRCAPSPQGDFRTNAPSTHTSLRDGSRGGSIRVTYTPVKVDIYVGHCIEATTIRQIERVTRQNNTIPDGATLTEGTMDTNRMCTTRPVCRSRQTVTVTADVTFRVEFSHLYSRVDGGQRTDFYGHRETRMATATAPGTPVTTALRAPPDPIDPPDVEGEGDPIDPPDVEGEDIVDQECHHRPGHTRLYGGSGGDHQGGGARLTDPPWRRSRQPVATGPGGVRCA